MPTGPVCPDQIGILNTDTGEILPSRRGSDDKSAGLRSGRLSFSRAVRHPRPAACSCENRGGSGGSGGNGGSGGSGGAQWGPRAPSKSPPPGPRRSPGPDPDNNNNVSPDNGKLPDVPDVKENSEKPNIYIYTDIRRDVSVIFDNPGDVSASVPHYPIGTGWHVSVDNNGIMEGRYRYLFYEALVEGKEYQYQYGWHIPARTRREELERVLRLYAFNDAETKDFLEYWEHRLKADTDYTMFPQETEVVDAVMPVQIDPRPQSVHRIWFIFTEVIRRDVTEPAAVERISRRPYTVIEWGGIVD